jgi:hypothetical protein
MWHIVITCGADFHGRGRQTTVRTNPAAALQTETMELPERPICE